MHDFSSLFVYSQADYIRFKLNIFSVNFLFTVFQWEKNAYRSQWIVLVFYTVAQLSVEIVVDACTSVLNYCSWTTINCKSHFESQFEF